MKNSYLTLFIEINDTNFEFFVTQNDEHNNIEITKKILVPLKGIEKKA